MSDADVQAIGAAIQAARPTWPGVPMCRHELATGEALAVYDDDGVLVVQFRGVRIPGRGAPYATIPIPKAMVAALAPEYLGRFVLEEGRAACALVQRAEDA